MTERAPMSASPPAATLDQRVFMHVSWSGFQSFLALRGNRGPRVTYAEGTLELMSPSRSHETLRAHLATIIQEHLKLARAQYVATGSWLLSSTTDDVALEPDDSYVFDDPSKARPDLAVEVIWTSGGIEKLRLYERIGVPEVWFWKNDTLRIYILTPFGYEQRETSSCLPSFDKQLACELLKLPFASDIIRVLNERLR